METEADLRAEVQRLREQLASANERLAKLDRDTGAVASSGLARDDVVRFARQMLMPSLGPDGQSRLLATSVLVVGAGGLGSPVILYLGGIGLGRIGIMDGDVVEVSNLHRQVIHDGAVVGVNKAESARMYVMRQNPKNNCKAYPFRLTPENALEIVGGYDIIVDATDNVAARYVINDACVLSGKPMVSGAALRTDGQVSVYHHEGGPCYRCINPVPPPPSTVFKADMVGVAGPAVGVIGCIQAMEVTKIAAKFGKSLTARAVFYDGKGCTFRVVQLRGRQAKCTVCGDAPTIKSMKDCDYQQFVGAVPVPSEEERKLCALTTAEFKALLDAGCHGVLIDVRPPAHFALCSLPGSWNIPLQDIAQHIEEIKKKAEGKPVTVICRRGLESPKAAETLREAGIAASHVFGGLASWSAYDPSFPIY